MTAWRAFPHPFSTQGTCGSSACSHYVNPKTPRHPDQSTDFMAPAMPAAAVALPEFLVPGRGVTFLQPHPYLLQRQPQATDAQAQTPCLLQSFLQLHQCEVRLLCNLLPKPLLHRCGHAAFRPASPQQQIDLPGSCAGAETFFARPILTSTPPIL
jgi:hypothetical protein